MRRISILFIAILFFSEVKSQTILPVGVSSYPGLSFANNSPIPGVVSKSKWFLSSYSGLSTGVSFFNGNNAAALALPIGIQLNRKLSNNFYAFTNVAVVPAFISLTPSLFTTGNNKNYPANLFMQNSFNIYPTVSLGLMYVNDARTFSISGSISAERSTYPIFPYQRSNKEPVIIHPER